MQFTEKENCSLRKYYSERAMMQVVYSIAFMEPAISIPLSLK